jgi:hypothetical protein
MQKASPIWQDTTEVRWRERWQEDVIWPFKDPKGGETLDAGGL